jgi:hypothetical protein
MLFDERTNLPHPLPPLIDARESLQLLEQGPKRRIITPSAASIDDVDKEQNLTATHNSELSDILFLINLFD